MCPFAEPSPEEKLQKLHTDIKFALKVDNPVRDAVLSNSPSLLVALKSFCVPIIRTSSGVYKPWMNLRPCL